ncbi:MAG TPA: YihY/virulence factor BrkB family protein [Gaiellales bacterium]|nr:YihY/virulence factor BrkB family protein [Gaiellales bacterium]
MAHGNGTGRELVATARRTAAVWAMCFRDNNLLTYASAIALQLLVALAALIFLAVALLHPLGTERTWTGTVEPALSSRLPIEWMLAIIWSVDRELHATSPGLIAFGAVVAIWEVSGAVRAMMGALNRIYGVDEKRSFTRRFGISFALAIAVSVLAIAAAFIGGGAFAAPVTPLAVAEQIVVPAAIVYVVVALLVIVAPAARQPWRWASAGAIGIIAAWLAVSAAYGYWIAQVENLRTPEGTLALVLSTVGYLYASAIAFLVGAQLDQLLREGGLDAALGRDPSAGRRERDSKRSGAHAPGLSRSQPR